MKLKTAVAAGVLAVLLSVMSGCMGKEPQENPETIRPKSIETERTGGETVSEESNKTGQKEEKEDRTDSEPEGTEKKESQTKSESVAGDGTSDAKSRKVPGSEFELPEYLDIALALTADQEEGIRFSKDAEGRDIGISDYWIDGRKIYLLSNIENRLFVYLDKQRIEEIDLNEAGVTAVRFAVHEGRIWIYDARGRIVLLEEGRISAEMNLVDFSESEEVEDFGIFGEDLYLTTAKLKEPGYRSFRITYSDGKLAVKDTIEGRAVQEGRVENPEKVAERLSGPVSETVMKLGYKLVEQKGMKDVGESEDGYRFYMSSVILSSKFEEDKQYAALMVFRFKDDSKTYKAYILPSGIPVCQSPVKMIDGNVYIMNTREYLVTVMRAEAYWEPQGLDPITNPVKLQ